MRKLIVANWKCNPTTYKQARALFGALSRGLKGTKAEVVVCPPFVYLPLAVEFFGGRKICQVKLGAQDCFWEKRGAFTGEISPTMLKDLGVKYVIVGHSERRALGETNDVVNKKVKAVLEAGITPILCIAETQEERQRGQAFLVVTEQLKEGLKNLAKTGLAKVILAYEPVWAISPQKPCSPDTALTVAIFCRKVMGELSSKKVAEGLKVLYGGNVNSSNVRDYLASWFLSGLLVGNASLDAQAFIKITKSV